MSKDIDAPERAQPSWNAMNLARAIRAARGSLTQIEFEQHAGRPQSVVSDWERGKRMPSLDTLCALESSLGLPLGLLAAQAGYFTAAAAVAAGLPGLPGLPISSLAYTDREKALWATAAADDLGLPVRMGSTGDGGWWVQVLAPVSESE